MAVRPDEAALADALDAWACVLDADGRILWSSGRVPPQAGVGADAAVGRSWLDLVDAGPQARHTIGAALASGQAADHSDPAPAVDVFDPWGGDAPAWRLSLRPRSGGGFWATARCLQEQHRLQVDRSRLSEVLRTVRQLGRVGVWEREIPSGRGRWDDTVFRLFGFDPEQGTPDFDQAVSRVHPDDRLPDHFWQTTRQVGEYQARYRVHVPDAGDRVIRSQWRVLPGPDGEPNRIVGVMSDETEVASLSRSFGTTAEQLQLAASIGGMTLWVHDLATQRMHYSDGAWALLGFNPRPEGLTIEEVRSLIHPDDLPAVVTSVERALATDGPVDFEARYRRADGQWRMVLSRRVVQRDAKGVPVAFVGVSIDLTDQRRSDERVRHLDEAVVAAGVGLWRRDLDTGEVEWNAPMHRIYAVPPNAPPLSYEAWLKLVHPDDRASLADLTHRTLAAGGGHYSVGFRIVRPDGETRWLEQRTAAVVRDGTRQLSGVTLDVTERVRAEQALRWANDRAALAARSAGLGTWSLDLRTGLVEWDPQMYQLRGLEPRDGPGPQAAERLAIVHPDDRALFDDEGAVPSPGQDGRSREFRVVLPDGRVRWLASRSRIVRDAGGQAVMHVGVNWDITDARAADQALKDREAALRASRAKSEFLARMSHELRTPLNAVLGFAQLLRGELGDASPHRMKVEHLHNAGEHLLSLINDVLDLTHLESGTLSLELQPVPLDAALAQALPLVEDLARRHGVRLERPDLDGAVALADPIRLRQVLVNLLSNAIKYNRAGGAVHVRVVAVGERLRLSVEDEGSGMTPEQLDHLFEPFNRLGAQRRGIEGTGIGLVIVKALCEAMGGTVRVASRPGQGTTVTLELPRAPVAPAPAPAPMVDAMPARPRPVAGSEDRPGSNPTLPSPPPPPRPGRGCLLYIEDNPVNVLLVRELVASRTRLTLHVAGTGAEGVALASALLPDLVLVDMQLPDMNGHDVLQQLRAAPATHHLPCIALSANAMREDIDRALAAGFDDYWTKPIDFGRFLAGLDRRFPAGADA